LIQISGSAVGTPLWQPGRERCRTREDLGDFRVSDPMKIAVANRWR